jgi:hypothetical protein
MPVNTKDDVTKFLFKNFIIALSLLATKHSVAQKEWTLAKESHGVRVYLRSHHGSNLKEFKAVTLFENTSLEYFYKLFKNGNEAQNWSYSVSYSKVLATLSPSEDVIYYKIDTPWPLKPRDVIQKQTLLMKENTELICTSYTLPEYLPKNKDYVRVVESSIKWTLHPKNKKDVEVIYEFYTDPKIQIPEKIVAHFIVNGPIYVFQKLKSYLKIHQHSHSAKNNGS